VKLPLEILARMKSILAGIRIRGDAFTTGDETVNSLGWGPLVALRKKALGIMRGAGINIDPHSISSIPKGIDIINSLITS